ncbi:MAG: cupin domain-containing protein [Haloferacaceae archaeon]
MEVVSREAVEEVEAVPGVHLGQLAAGERMSVQHYTVEPGERVPEHSHPHEQAGFVTAGTAVFVVDGREVRASVGDSYVVPGGEPHAVENRGDVPFTGVDVFSPPRENPDWEA